MRVLKVPFMQKGEHKGKKNFLLTIIAIKPIILTKNTSSKMSNSFIVIIAIRMVISRAILMPSKTKQINSLHSKQIVQKIKRKI